MMVMYATTAVAAIAMMVLLWALSVRLRDASIVDAWWGPGFVLIAWIAFGLGDGYETRRILLTGMTTLWGLRLGWHIQARNQHLGEDYRYAAMRESWGPRFWWVSLFTVFLLQGLLQWFISLPLQVGQADPTAAALGWLDAAGIGVWSVGLAFEALGDRQLRRFKADPDNRGKVLDTGLWRYTRHPNYFGDALVWWGLYLVAAATPTGAWTIASPALMTWLLTSVSGVSLLERSMNERPGYREYVERTSAFIPWPPKPAVREVGSTAPNR